MTIFEMPQTYLRMGHNSQSFQLPLEEAFAEAGASLKEFGLLVLWKASSPWLQVSFSLDNGPEWEDGSPQTMAFKRVCKNFEVSETKLVPKSDDFLTRVGQGKRNDTIAMHVTVLTDNRRLVRSVTERQKSEPAGSDLHVDFQLYAFDQRNGQQHFYRHQVKLHIEPLTPLPQFGGFVSLDLGNSSTGIAALRNNWVTIDDTLLLDTSRDGATLTRSGSNLESLVRLDKVTTWYPTEANLKASIARQFPDPQFPQDDKKESVSWVVGKAVRDGMLARQVSGAKRFLARPDKDQTFAMPLDHTRVSMEMKNSINGAEVVQVRYRLPAELLAARIMERFLQARQFGRHGPAGWPRYLAVTYPTSYSPSEIHALRTAVHRGWLRALNEHQSPQDVENEDDNPSVDEVGRRRIVRTLQSRLDPRHNKPLGDAQGQEDDLIRLMIDEATAASFHFLYKFSADAVGGLVGFRFRYPEGMNLLLYDCGGGTTDIALVQARVQTGDKQITMAVLGRSGVRQFGGDDITTALCRLLEGENRGCGYQTARTITRWPEARHPAHHALDQCRPGPEAPGRCSFRR